MPATTKKFKYFTKKVPDQLTDELCATMKAKKRYSFNGLFEQIYGQLKARNAANSSEEMMRLRTYEKLQNLVQKGMVNRKGQEYTATSRLHEGLSSYVPVEE